MHAFVHAFCQRSKHAGSTHDAETTDLARVVYLFRACVFLCALQNIYETLEINHFVP